MNQILNRQINDKVNTDSSNCVSTSFYLLGLKDRNKDIDPRTINIENLFDIIEHAPIDEVDYGNNPKESDLIAIVKKDDKRVLHTMIPHPLNSKFVIQKNHGRLNMQKLESAIAEYADLNERDSLSLGNTKGNLQIWFCKLKQEA